MLLFAARGVADRFTSSMGSSSGLLLGVLIFIFYIMYIVRARERLPYPPRHRGRSNLCPSSSGHDPANAPPRFLARFPYHYRHLGLRQIRSFALSLVPILIDALPTYSTVLLAVNVAIAIFLLSRKQKAWATRSDGARIGRLYVLGSFFLFAASHSRWECSVHFIAFAPQWITGALFLGLSLAILVFTAWPEELLFRGLLQNLLTRSSKSEMAGWWTSSVLFGLSHITNGGYPNWRYVILATLAGLFYAWTWRKTNSIFASALVHAAVDISWHFLFRTL